MRRTVRGIVAVAVLAGVVLGVASAADAKPKKQSTAKYAKTMCMTYSQLQTDFANYTGAIGNLDDTDTAGFSLQAVTQTNAFLDKVKTDEKTLQGVYPDISNGKKVGSLLATRPAEMNNILGAALSQLQSGTGPAGPAVFKAALMTLPSKLSDPISKVKDQGLINALQKERSCKDVIQVIR